MLQHTPAAVWVTRAQAGRAAQVLLTGLHGQLAHLGTATSACSRIQAPAPHRPAAHLLLTQEVDVPVVRAEEQVSQDGTAIHDSDCLIQMGILGAIDPHLSHEMGAER